MKIKMVHLLCLPHHQREINSVDSLKPLNEIGIDYVKHINAPYKGSVPTDNCRRPNDVSNKRIRGKLHFGHYGAWLSHKRAVLEEFSEDLDAFMVCECDCILKIPSTIFVNEVFEAIKFMKMSNVDYLSFGNTEPFSHLFDDKIVKKRDGKYLIVDNIYKTHCIIFSSNIRRFLVDSFINAPWDNIDYFLSAIFRNKKIIAITKQELAIQKGQTLIDLDPNIPLL